MLISGLFQKKPPGGPEIRVREVVGGCPSLEASELSGSEEESTPERIGLTQVTHGKTRTRIFSLQVQNPPITNRCSLLFDMLLGTHQLCSKPRKQSQGGQAGG